MNWNDVVFEARHKFYELNYFTTVQLLALRRELGMLNDSSHNADVPLNVLVLLQSISSQIESDTIRSYVREVTDPRFNLGSPDLEESITDEREGATKTPLSGDSATFDAISDIVWPTLKEDELTTEEKGIMAFIVHRLNCSKLLVLKAFEECQDENMNRYKYVTWCSNNINVYKFEEHESQSDEDSDEIIDQEEPAAPARPTKLSYLLGKNIYIIMATCPW